MAVTFFPISWLLGLETGQVFYWLTYDANMICKLFFKIVIRTLWEWICNRFNTRGLFVFSAVYIKFEVNHDV